MRSVRPGRARPAAIFAALASVAPWLPPLPAHAEPAPAVLRKLNRERAAARLPTLTLDGAQSAGCKLHDRWMARNHALSAVEPVGSPGYTVQGAAAGRDALLAAGTSWRDGDPWRNAPLQHALLLEPGLTSVGAAESHGYSCVTVTMGLKTPVVSHDTVWTAPATGGQVPFAQRARERPLLPQTRVGIRPGQLTGPYLNVFAQSPLAPAYPPAPVPVGFDPDGAPIWGPDKAAYEQQIAAILAFPLPLSRITHATLNDRHGRSVQVRVIDNARLDGRLGPGNGFLLPLRPLQPNARYHATVTLATAGDVAPGEARTFTYHWAFKTNREQLSSR